MNSDMVIVFLVALLIGLVIGLVIFIFYALTLSGALKQCSPQNQRMSPGQVWLLIIPVFGQIWHFFVVSRIAESLAAEFKSRHLPVEEEKPGYNVGIAYCILSVSSYIQYLGIPVVGQLASLAGFVCWIIYWVRINRYKKRLEEHRFQFGQGNPYPFPPQFPGSSQGGTNVHF